MRASNEDEVWICSKWWSARVHVSDVASSKIFIIDPLIIGPSSYMAQHILPAQFTVRCLIIVQCVIYHLSVASIPPTCHWSLSCPGRKWITEREREREGIGKGRKCTEINLVKRTRLCVVHSGLEDQHLWFPLKRKDIDYSWRGERLSLFPSGSPILS